MYEDVKLGDKTTTGHHYLVPEQFGGAEANLESEVEAADHEEAEELFVDAKERLWNINKWASCCPETQVQFTITDHRGRPVARRARKDDHIRLKRMMSGGIADDDWVAVEAVEYDDYPDDNSETFALHLRQVADPGATKTGMPERLPEPATSTLVVERKHTKVRATYHGRNEAVDSGKADELTGDASVQWLGLSHLQWQCLLTGFMGAGQTTK